MSKRDPNRPKGADMNIRDVPPHLKRQWRAWCIRRGYTMRGAIIATMRNQLEADVPIKGAKDEHRIGS